MTDRQTTHAPDCWSWGPGHYECAVREIKRLQADVVHWREGRRTCLVAGDMMKAEIERLRSEIESLRRQPLPTETITDLWSQAIVQAAIAGCTEVVEFARAIERAHGIEGDAC